jgi:hypothetical protein
MIDKVRFMEPRILRIGEEVTGKCKDMKMGRSKKFFQVKLGEDEFYLPKDVGSSLLKSREKGYEVFTIHRTWDVYEIKPVAESV